MLLYHKMSDGYLLVLVVYFCACDKVLLGNKVKRLFCGLLCM